MSERKVLQKYYPPDFDPSAIGRQKKPKDAVTKLATVRLMAPFGMKCTTCGEYIYKGRKFNARKEVTSETYYSIKIIRFYIRCTRCSAEITFKTDPKTNDYEAEKGARRNFEPWREAKLAEETEEERLDRLEREEAEYDPMKELESKTLDAKTEMAIADKLDEIRTRNARLERKRGADETAEEIAARQTHATRDEERERQEAEDAEAARLAFASGTGEKIRRLVPDDDSDDGDSGEAAPSAAPSASTSTSTSTSASAPAPAPASNGSTSNGHIANAGSVDASSTSAPSFARAKKRKVDFTSALGIKKKKPLV